MKKSRLSVGTLNRLRSAVRREVADALQGLDDEEIIRRCGVAASDLAEVRAGRESCGGDGALVAIVAAFAIKVDAMIDREVEADESVEVLHGAKPQLRSPI